MSTQEEQNKALILRLVEEVYNDNDLDVLDELLAEDFVNHSAVPEHRHGIEGFKHVNKWVRDWHRLAEGKLIERWAVRDDLGAAQQLGLLPS